MLRKTHKISATAKKRGSGRPRHYGTVPDEAPGQPGKRVAGGASVWSIIQKKLQIKIKDGKINAEKIADRFIKDAERGSLGHALAIIDRQEGKVPQRLANSDGSNIKHYVGLPIGGQEGAP